MIEGLMKKPPNHRLAAAQIMIVAAMVNIRDGDGVVRGILEQVLRDGFTEAQIHDAEKMASIALDAVIGRTKLN